MYDDLIDQIDNFSKDLESVVSRIDKSQLDRNIREGAWTIRQSINHLVDSHVNSFIRLKFALTENSPSIMAYNEEKWVELFDTKDMDISATIAIINGLHCRIAYILKNINVADWGRTLNHSESGLMTLGEYVKIMADHGPNHLNSVIKALDLK